MTPQPRGNAEDVSGKLNGTERLFFGSGNQTNRASETSANAGPAHFDSRSSGSLAMLAATATQCSLNFSAGGCLSIPDAAPSAAWRSSPPVEKLHRASAA